MPFWLPADRAIPEFAGGACILCRLSPLPLACFAAPIPPAPFPGGEGGDSKFILPGATAPGTPALDRLRHVQTLPYRCPAAEPGRHWGRGRTMRPAVACPAGSDYPLGVISRDPAYPAAYCPQRSRTRWSDHGSTRALRHRPACRPAGSDCRTSPARCRRFSAEAQDPSQSP